MAVSALSPTRALHQPRRLDWRAFFGLFLLLLATGGSIAFWSASSDTRSVLVATRDLPEGAVLTAGDVATARVRVDDGMYQAAIPATDLTNVVGHPLAEPVHAQQMLVPAQLASRPALAPGQVAVTIAVHADTAVGGRLRPGDTVEVLATINQGKPEAQTTVVLPGATVYDVGRDQNLTVVNTGATDPSGTSGPIAWVTLVVNSDQAVQLTRAKWAGQLDVALLPPGRQ